MKKGTLLLLIVFIVQANAQIKEFAVLWIGNSLTQGAPSWCQGEGWEFANQVLVNPKASITEINAWSAAVMRGATDLDVHWNTDLSEGEGACTGIGELRLPTGCRNRTGKIDWMSSLDHYDYVVLQGYKWAPPYTDEIDYASRYCDLALENGVVPILFACWEDPSVADGAVAVYDSLYRKYRNRGAVLAPIAQAHRLVWNDPSKNAVSYLYVTNDAYHHSSLVGTFLNACVFYEVFTGRSSVGISLADMLPFCSDIGAALTEADVAYCASKAHQAVVDYYGPGNTPYLGRRPLEWSVSFAAGAPRPIQSRTIMSTDIFASDPLSAAITVTNTQPWLRATVNAALLDSQVITASIDASSLPNVSQKYFDTLTFRAAGLPDRTLPVCVWIRDPSVAASIVITPNTVTTAIGQDLQFRAMVIDQYDVAMTPQPSLVWSATGGSISSSGLHTAGSSLGSFTVRAAVSSIVGSATVTISLPNHARSATASVSSLENGHTAQAINDGVISGYPADASKEWSTNGERAGAWAQLTWPSAVIIDSIALWDRPNTVDQVTSGTLTFSDGSNISVGPLPNDAGTCWSQKFTSKSVTWARFTVNTVSSGTANAGLAEFQTLNCAAAIPNAAKAPALNPLFSRVLSSTEGRMKVNLPANASWDLELFALDGVRIAVYTGKGPADISFGRSPVQSGFVMARLRSGTLEVKRVIVGRSK